jgi:hypothetical protein
MEYRRAMPLLISVLATLAVFHPVGATRAGRDTPANEASESSAEPSAVEPAEPDFPTAKEFVSQFLFSAEEKAALAANAAKLSYSIDFLIATAPDPIRSPLPHFFDGFVESLESAAEVAGYTLDRFALPWPLREPRDDRTNWHPPLYESVPGLILFRDPIHQKLLLVFLVGETATTGIHKLAMFSALEQIAQFYPWDPRHSELPPGFPQVAPPAGSGSSGGATVRIMGPAFSGSAVSLRFILNRWSESQSNRSNVRFQIVSGTATAINPNSLTQAAQGHTTFQATVPPDSETLAAIACYIDRLGYSKIAVLTEGNTAYGQNFTKQTTAEKVTGGRNGGGCGSGVAAPEILSLPFPMHISRLRATTNKQTSQQAQTETATDTSNPASAPTKLDRPSEPREVLPSYSDLSIQSAELTLANLLSAISREQFSYVGIVATDVRDVIFLAREVRQHCPATVLFTLNSDLLYAQPEVNTVTRGMLVITPYPLFNLEQLWTYAYGGGKSRLQFANQAAEGVYNATLALLGEDGKMVDYGTPLAVAAESQAGALHKPSLWVTAIGNEKTLPVRLLPWNDESNYTYSPIATTEAKTSAVKPAVGRGIFAENTVVAVIVLSLFLAAFALLLIAQYWRPEKSGAFKLFALLGDTASSAYWSECRLFLLCACMSLLALYVVIAADFCLPFITGRVLGSGIQTTATPRVAAGIAMATILLLFVATHKLLSAFRQAPSNQRGSAPEVIFFALLSCALVFVLAVSLDAAWLGHVRDYPASGLFNHLRSFDLGGGLSPLLPLSFVALGACLWALCSFRRLRVLDILRATGTPEKPHSWLRFLSLDVRSFSGVRDLENSVTHILESSSVISLRWYLFLMVLSLSFGHYFFSTRLVRALEPRPFYWVFEAAFIIVYWALLTEFLRLVFAWRSLHLLLQRLSWHPLLAAFKRYRESRPNLPKMDLTHPPSSFAALQSSVHQACCLVSSARGLAQAPEVGEALRESFRKSLPEWEAELQGAESHLCEALRLEWAADPQDRALLPVESAPSKRATQLKGDWRQSLKARCHAQHSLFRFSQTLGRVMEDYWTPPYLEGAAGVNTSAAKEFFDHGEEFIVSRVVNFLAIVLPSLQNLGYFGLAGLLLMLLAVTSYPFQPRNEFLFFNWIVILSFVGTVFWIFVQMDRDTVLSLLNDSKPGQISFSREFVLRTLLYVAVPLLALLGAQFPESLRQLLVIFTTVQGSS